ncbi:hypothetical protein IAG41_21290 [Sphingomonas sp. JC676]|uniref:hypothetical protein n=1 Tax=Sphingomonas sp. JC676 TaxID=2768065 RepID=UPI001657CDF9|nr:hypothetical protein [Sphingomonas sp. JC676]MBC9034934.1 hypothetical protein [Sphingomonas sp. JC676]
MLRSAILAVAAAMLMTPGISAAQQMRTIEVPASKKWQHAATGLIVPQALGGMARTGIGDTGNQELDVVVQFRDEDDTRGTLYLFRPALMNVPVWFDRVETQIFGSDAMGDPTPTAATLAFAPPHSSTAGALRRVYKPSKPPFSATGAAILPLGEWLVVLRLSSPTLDPAALDAKLSEAIAGLGWPTPRAGSVEAPASVPIEACASPLAFANKAKAKKPDTSMALLGAIMANMAQDPEIQEKAAKSGPVSFCREGNGERQLGAYRALPLSGDAYVIAIADAGRTIDVSPEIPLDGKRAGYSVTLNDLATSLVYPSFDKLPAPAKVFDMISKTGPISSTTRNGKDTNITINTP